MNKTEQREFERLKTMLALKHWPEVLPDVAPPTPCVDSFGKLTTGYIFNTHSKTVCVACSSSIGHAIGSTDKTTSQLALQAMLHELSMLFANEMRQVEKMLEAEEK